MPAPKGNHNAKGNRGGGAPTMNDRKLAAEVRSLALTEIKGILRQEGLTEMKKQVLLKLAPSLLPRLNEHTGEDGEAISHRVIYIPQRNERLETTPGKAD